MLFNQNTSFAIANSSHSVNLTVHQCKSEDALCNLVAAGYKKHFDFIYIDGSHFASDVLLDAVLGFKLLRTGGLMIFDDYLWRRSSETDVNPLTLPKIAIDSFVNIYHEKVEVLTASNYQLYLQKVTD